MKDFISKFESLLDYSGSEEKETLILGDLNCDLAAKKLSADNKELCMLFKVYQFIQLIKEPTRIIERSSTLLDLAFTTDQGKISDSGVLECSISDHSLVYIIRKARPPRGPIKTIKCRSYKNYSAPNFVRDLHSASWDVINTSLTVDEAWTSFKDIFVTIADRHAPTHTRRVRSNTLPWMTDHIRALITQRNFHHKKAQKTGSSYDWQEYRSVRNRITVTIKETKRAYYSNLIQENKNHSSKLWSAIKSAIGSNVKASQNQSLLIDGEGLKQISPIQSKFQPALYLSLNP